MGYIDTSATFKCKNVPYFDKGTLYANEVMRNDVENILEKYWSLNGCHMWGNQKLEQELYAVLVSHFVTSQIIQYMKSLPYGERLVCNLKRKYLEGNFCVIEETPGVEPKTTTVKEMPYFDESTGLLYLNISHQPEFEKFLQDAFYQFGYDMWDKALVTGYLKKHLGNHVYSQIIIHIYNLPKHTRSVSCFNRVYHQCTHVCIKDEGFSYGVHADGHGVAEVPNSLKHKLGATVAPSDSADSINHAFIQNGSDYKPIDINAKSNKGYVFFDETENVEFPDWPIAAKQLKKIIEADFNNSEDAGVTTEVYNTKSYISDTCYGTPGKPVTTVSFQLPAFRDGCLFLDASDFKKYEMAVSNTKTKNNNGNAINDTARFFKLLGIFLPVKVATSYQDMCFDRGINHVGVICAKYFAKAILHGMPYLGSTARNAIYYEFKKCCNSLVTLWGFDGDHDFEALAQVFSFSKAMTVAETFYGAEQYDACFQVIDSSACYLLGIEIGMKRSHGMTSTVTTTDRKIAIDEDL